MEDDKDTVDAKLVNDLFAKKKAGKAKRNRSGYADDVAMHTRKTHTVAHFMTAKEPVKVLAQSSTPFDSQLARATARGASQHRFPHTEWLLAR